ncbi:MAG: hypothetical protein ACUZ8I_13375 [Candidatus Scalindua sp.]
MEFKDKGSIDLFFKRLAELIEEDIDKALNAVSRQKTQLSS